LGELKILNFIFGDAMNKLFAMFLTCSFLMGQEIDIDDLQVKSGRCFQRSKPYSGSIYDKYFFGGVSLSGKMENGYKVGVWKIFFSSGKVEIEWKIRTTSDTDSGKFRTLSEYRPE